MKGRQSQSFLGGAIILTASVIVVKIIGMLFKIPLTNLLGGTGMGYFNTAYNIFTPIYTLAIAGLPIAVSKMVAENMSCGRYRDVRRIKNISACFFLSIGLIGFSVLFFGAERLSDVVGNKGSCHSVMAIAPTVFFCCVLSIYRGYYQGMRNMIPTAVSQVVEAAVKLTAGIALARYALYHTQTQYNTTGMIFGTAYDSAEVAAAASAQYAAAAAVLGVSLSTVFGVLYIIIRHLLKGDGISENMLSRAPAPEPSKAAFRRMAGIAFPVCLGALVPTLTTIIDVASIMNNLRKAMSVNVDVILLMYRGMYPPGLPIDELPVHLYGSYTGIAVTLFNLVPALVTSFGVSALPHIAAAWASKNRSDLKHGVDGVLRLTSLVALPAGLGITFMAEPIVNLLYSARPMESAIAIPMLKVLGLSAAFVSILSPVSSMLQAMGKAYVTVKYIFIGGLIKVISNYIFVAIPSINIKAAPYGTLLCYSFAAVMSLIELRKYTNIKIDVVGVFCKPLFASILCAAASAVTYSFGQRGADSRIVTILSIAFGVFIYIISLILTKALTKDEILVLPKGENIVKRLEKLGLLG